MHKHTEVKEGRRPVHGQECTICIILMMESSRRALILHAPLSGKLQACKVATMVTVRLWATLSIGALASAQPATLSVNWSEFLSQ
jgi:hypothetical protein